MISFIIRRTLQAVVVMLAVGFVAFAAFRFSGDPVSNMLGQESTRADREALYDQLGFNDPIPLQFWDFISRAAVGDFGVSYRLGRPVGDMILERLPTTLELGLASGVIAIILGVGFGVFTALRRRSALSQTVMTLSLVGVSLPTFVIGIALIYIFAVELRWLPSFGRGEVVDLGGWRTGLLTWSGIESLIMPALTLGLYQTTLLMRLVRSEMLEVLRADFIKFARARGLSDARVHFRHALKNTLVPVITIIGLQLGAVLAFAIVTETVFQLPGVGLMFIEAVRFVDIPVMATYLLLVAAFFVALNLVVDLLYFAVDPRLRVERGGLSAR